MKNLVRFTSFFLLAFLSFSVKAQQINDFDNLNEYKEFKQQINLGSNLDLALSAFDYTSFDFAEKKNGYMDQQILGEFEGQSDFSPQENFLYNLSENNTLLDSIVTYDYIYEDDSIYNSKTIYTRNADGYQTLLFTYKWISATSTWIYNTKSAYSYDENYNLVLRLSYKWNSELNDWEETKKNEYGYDENNNQTLTIIYKWNSEINDWEGTYKTEYAFDNNGNTLLSARYEWDINLNQWVGYSIKYEYAFYESGLLQYRATYTWDTEINNWLGNNKSEYFYDNNDYLITIIGYSFEDDWEFNTKSEYANHEDGQPELRLQYFWMGSDWEIDYKEEYSYNTDLELILVMIYYWYNNSWHETIKIVHDYDENGNENLYAFYYWNDLQWKGQIKNTSIYDETGNMTNRKRYEWDEITNDWMPDNEYDMTYDEHGNMLSFFYYYNWDKEQNDWINMLKEYYIYNVDNQLELFEYYEWDVDSEVWVGNEKEISTYDDEGNLAAFATYDWDSEISDWILLYKHYYYYSDFYVANEEQENINMVVYPNPIKNYVIVEFQIGLSDIVRIDIIDIQGKIVHGVAPKTYSSGESKVSINTSAFPSGIYFYRISTENKTSTGKLIKM